MFNTFNGFSWFYEIFSSLNFLIPWWYSVLFKDMYICSQHNHVYTRNILQLELLFSQPQANFLLEITAHSNDLFLEIGSNSSTLISNTEVSSLHRHKCIIVIFPLTKMWKYDFKVNMSLCNYWANICHKKIDSLGISFSIKLLVQGFTANKKFKYHTVFLN